MLQKTKLTLLRLFAIVAFVALFVFASISLASCSSDSAKTVVNMEIIDGYLYVTYSDSETAVNLGKVTGSDGYEGSDGDDGVSIDNITLDESTGELVITYTDSSKAETRISIADYIAGVVEDSECDHNYVSLPNGEGVYQEQTCGQDGLSLKYCTICNNAIISIDAATGDHTYDYTNLVWDWASDYSSATATATCTVCGAEDVLTATVESDHTTVEGCATIGMWTYTGTVTLPDGTTSSDVQTLEVKPTGLHTYKDSDGVEHTIYMTPEGEYPAYIYVDENIETLTPATYDDLCDLFGADHLMVSDCLVGASLISSNTELTCTTCGEDFHGVTPAFEHTAAAAAVIENTVEATCEVDGSYEEVYYCTLCGEEVSRETKVIPATGHNFVYDDTQATVWTWATDYSSATLTFYCTICGGTHVEDATVTDVYTALSCQAAESHTYTATVIYNYTYYTDTQYVELDNTGVVGYHTTLDGQEFVVIDNYMYLYDTASGEAYGDPLTVSDFLALGGIITKYGGTNNISYGYIYCSSCNGGDSGKVSVTLPKGGHHFEETSAVTWTWATGYVSATANVICEDCQEVVELTATISQEANQAGNGTIYTATVTYGKVTLTDSIEVVDVEIDVAATASLSSATAPVYNAEVTTVDAGYYAIEFTSTTSYITVTDAEGKYTYTSYTAASALSKAVALEEAAAVNYLLDENGDPAYIPAGTTLYITIALYESDTAVEAPVSFTVATAEAPAMAVGEEFVVTIGSDSTLETTITISEEGYYAISFTDGALVTIYDDSNTYYYYSGSYYVSYWSGVGSYSWGTMGYVVDYDTASTPIVVAANTTLNVEISYYSDATEIYVLIEKGSFTALSADVETTISGSDVYTFTATEDGKYVFTVDADGDVYVGENEIYYDDSITLTLSEGDVVFVYNNTSYATTSIVTVTLKQPISINYVDFNGTVYNVSDYNGEVSEYGSIAVEAGTALIKNVLSVDSTSGKLYIATDILTGDDISIDSTTTVYEGVDLDRGILISTSGSMTFTLSKAADVTFYYGLNYSSSVFTLTDSDGNVVFTLSDENATSTYNILCYTVSLAAGDYTLTSTGSSTRLYSIAVAAETVTATIDNVYGDYWAQLILPITTIDATDAVTNVHDTGTYTVYWYLASDPDTHNKVHNLYGDSGAYSGQIMFSTLLSTVDDVPAFVIVWTDADGNVVATATYGDVTGGGTETEPQDVTYDIVFGEQGTAVSNTDTWYYWNDQWWCGSNVTVSSAAYDNGTVDITYTLSGNCWYGMQIFYKNAELTAGSTYKLTLTIVSDTAGNITVNGTVYTLVVGTNEITVYYTEGSETASVSIQMGECTDTENNTGTCLAGATISISNVSWSETYLLAMDNVISFEDDTSTTESTTIAEAGTYYFTTTGYSTEDSEDSIISYTTKKSNSDKFAEAVTVTYENLTLTNYLQFNGSTSSSNGRYLELDLSSYAGKNITITVVTTGTKTDSQALITTSATATSGDSVLASGDVNTDTSGATLINVTYTADITSSNSTLYVTAAQTIRVYAVIITVNGDTAE